MKAFSLAFILMLGVGLALFSEAAFADGKSVEGIWQGKLSVQGMDIRIIFKIASKGGMLTGTLDSPDQGAKDIPLDMVTFVDGKLALTLAAAGLKYEGALNAAGTEIAGTLKQGGAELPLTLKHDANIVEKRRPQEPARPYPYLEEEVSYANPKAPGVTLAGTLTLPKGDGPFPAVLLITGSGPQNRDEELLGHKPFLILSDYLTRHGIAVLRVDDRGIAKSTGNFATATTADFVTDVEAGVAFLNQHKKIRAKQIGLIGHSEGGVIAPKVASESKDVAFIVLMAGTGVSGEEIVIEQAALIAQADGATAEAIAAQKASQQKIFAIVKGEPDPAKAEKSLSDLVQAQLAQVPEAQRKAVETSAMAQIKSVNSPWFRYFLTYDPRPALTRVKCPVLALNGEKDLQVPPKQNLPVIEAALKEGGNKDFTIKLLPGLNHLFQTCKTGSPSEYAKIEETLSPDALKVMGDWIEAHTHGAK